LNNRAKARGRKIYNLAKQIERLERARDHATTESQFAEIQSRLDPIEQEYKKLKRSR